jgi:hypothetical protein
MNIISTNGSHSGLVQTRVTTAGITSTLMPDTCVLHVALVLQLRLKVCPVHNVTPTVHLVNSAEFHPVLLQSYIFALALLFKKYLLHFLFGDWRRGPFYLCVNVLHLSHTAFTEIL